MLVASSVLVWVIRIAVIVSVGMVLWKSRSAFEANDFRLGLIAAALAYLLTVLVEEQFSANHLAALRTVRQNLAFSRITPEDACNQTDLLLFTGGSATQSVQHQLDGILTMADQIRSNYAQIESLLPNYNYLVSEIARPKFEGELLLTKAEESDKLRDFLLRLFTQAQEQHEALHKRTKKLEGHIKAIAFFSPSAAKETEPLTEKVKVALAPLSEQRKKIQRALLPAAFAAGANLR